MRRNAKYCDKQRDAPMQISAEIRWFWKRTTEPELAAWFVSPKSHGEPAGGGNLRTDVYLIDRGQNELGFKLRGGKKGVEVKGLVQTIVSGCRVDPFAGDIEVWTKWTSGALKLDGLPLIEIEKRRWLRKFDTSMSQVREIAVDADERPIGGVSLPDEGCNVEYTEIRGEAFEFVTLGFEAFGALGNVVHGLRRTAAALASRSPPMPNGGLLASYPSWIPVATT
jgi:hypothetical protein